MSCWVCGSDDIHKNPDYRPIEESKYICKNCGNHMGSLKDVCEKEESLLTGEKCLYLFNKDNECHNCPMVPPKQGGFYPT